MNIRQLFLERHACVHANTMTDAGTWKEEDTVCSDLTEAELRSLPTDQHNSVAWLLWHMARCEDVAVNTTLRASDEVLDQGQWLPKLGITSRHIGTGATIAEVKTISQKIDLDALRAYRAAVGRETRAWASTVDFDTLDETISAADAKRTAAKGDFGAQGDWVEPYWANRGWSRGNFLFWLAIEHNWLHYGQIWVTRTLLGRPKR